MITTHRDPVFNRRSLRSQSPPADDLPPVERDEPSEYPDEIEVPWTDEAYWDVFVADDDQRDPLPELGDFWIEDPEELRAIIPTAISR